MDSTKADHESKEFEIVNTPIQNKDNKQNSNEDNNLEKICHKNLNIEDTTSKSNSKTQQDEKKITEKAVTKNGEKESSTENSKNEFIDYSVPLIMNEDFSEEQLKIIFKTEANLDKGKVEELPIEKVPFLEEMKVYANTSKTENNFPTFKTTGDERLDFFFQVMERLRKGLAIELLSKSWDKAPLDTLKLLAFLRDIRQGKGIRTQYQHCLYWLYQNHPKTLAYNLKHLATFGYWKDLLHLLTTIFFYGEVPHYLEVDDWPALKQKSKLRRKMQLVEIEQKRNILKTTFVKPDSDLYPGCKTKRGARAQLQAQRWNALNSRVFNNLLLINLPKMDPEFKLNVPNFEYLPKNERRELTLKFARFRLENDVKYRYFHVKIAQLFAEQLQIDKIDMNIGGDKSVKKEISLAGKWAPSVTNHFDKYTLIGTTIALELVKLENVDLKMEKSYESVRAFLARKRYHKEYLVPLREYLKTPEVLMSAKLWSKVDYNRVPALCMRRYIEVFLKHDKERFEIFTSKKNKITGPTLKPIQIITELMTSYRKSLCTKTIETEILENQWRSLVADIKDKKKSAETLQNALVICDVSGSMRGEPLYAALGLTILVMDLTDSPWNEMCITFDHEPSICKINPNDSLLEKLQSLMKMPFGMNIDFIKLFELILKWTEDIKSNAEEKVVVLPKTLFVFTDMEYDLAFSGATQTNFENIKDKFTKAGFEMPNIIFWNLRGDKCRTCIPVLKDERGTVLMSGYSGQLLKLILENHDMNKFNPVQMMELAIANKSYEVLELFD